MLNVYYINIIKKKIQDKHKHKQDYYGKLL